MTTIWTLHLCGNKHVEVSACSAHHKSFTSPSFPPVLSCFTSLVLSIFLLSSSQFLHISFFLYHNYLLLKFSSSFFCFSCIFFLISSSFLSYSFQYFPCSSIFTLFPFRFLSVLSWLSCPIYFPSFYLPFFCPCLPFNSLSFLSSSLLPIYSIPLSFSSVSSLL